MKVSIIGCGNIGSELARYIDSDNRFELTAVADVNHDHACELLKILWNNQPEVTSINQAIEKSELIIESASKKAAEEILRYPDLDKKNRKLLFMSTGGVIENLERFNSMKNCKVYVPSGAVAGLDAIGTVADYIESLTLESTKTLKSLEEAPYVVDSKIDLKNMRTKKTIFEGSIRDAVSGFPQNINVAATLYLATRFEDLLVKIIADPLARFNTHQITCKGRFGCITARSENVLSLNPKTSYLAVLSAVSILKNLMYNIRIGS